MVRNLRSGKLEVELSLLLVDDAQPLVCILHVLHPEHHLLKALRHLMDLQVPLLLILHNLNLLLPQLVVETLQVLVHRHNLLHLVSQWLQLLLHLLVLVLEGELLARLVVSLALAPPTELHLEPLVISVVIFSIFITLGTPNPRAMRET